MKTRLKYLSVLCCFFVSIFQLRSQGYIEPNGVVANLFPGEIDLNWPAETQINGFEFTPVGKTSDSLPYANIFTFGEPVTIGVRVFSISYDQPFSLNSVVSGTYTEISNPTDPAAPASPTIIFNGDSPFYVVLYSGAEFAAYYPPGNTNPVYYTDPVFGWAELENVNGAIELLDGALEYQGGGIYAGTENIIPVPEPSEFALGTLGALLLGFRRWRNSSR
jgi:hypothetical protein